MAKKITPKKQIKEAVPELKDLMIKHLSIIAENMIDQIIGVYKYVPDSKNLDAIKGVQPSGVQEYKRVMLEILSELAADSINLARKEVPKAKKVRLAEVIETIKFGPTIFESLPPALQKKIKTRNDLLIGKQIGDLQATINFAYANNEDTTDSESTIEEDLHDSALGFLEGPSINAGAEITAATVISDARNAFFFDDDVLEEIEAFEFVNEDPVTPICTDLAGTIFAKDDPDMFRYTPPLHWNCKSWIRPITNGNLNDREIEKLQPSTKKIEDTIQFSDESIMHRDCKNCC